MSDRLGLPPLPRERRVLFDAVRFASIWVAAWAAMASGYALIIMVQSPSRSVGGALSGGFWTSLTPALLGLGVWWLAGTLAARKETGRAIVAHAVSAVTYSGVWVGTIILSIAVFVSSVARADYLRYAAGWQFVTGLLVYGIIAGISHAVHTGRRLRQQQAAAARSEALRAKAELSALRAHMNPHFLFNTLHSISALVRKNPAAVETALERLASLFRFVLDIDRRGVDQIPLGDELAFVRTQLELERLRLGDRLTIVEELEPDSLDCLIPVFTLQPLVENAIRHGIAPVSAGGTITIRAQTAGDSLEITVIDTGAGADMAGLGRAAGLGLRSIRQRIGGLYGDSGGLSIESQPGRGTTARVRLPMIASVGAADRAAALVF